LGVFRIKKAVGVGAAHGFGFLLPHQNAGVPPAGPSLMAHHHQQLFSLIFGLFGCIAFPQFKVSATLTEKPDPCQALFYIGLAR
jgi:hypothetical protein